MKFNLLPLRVLLGLWLGLLSGAAGAQSREAKQQIKREFTLTGAAGSNSLTLYNIFGSITVQGYAGSAVVVEATKTVRAGDATALAQGQREAQLGFEQRADSLIVYLSGPQDSRPRRNNYHNSRDLDYSYEFDFVVKVPTAMQVSVSTVNGGQVLVADVSGPLRARNVNGGIVLRRVGQLTQAHTVNGDVEVSYAAAPTRAASYHTINGDITVSYPSGVSGDVFFKSLHGELFTDFPQAALLPARVSQSQQRAGSGTKYKISQETALRLGKGGLDFRFETINGNATVKKL